MTRELTVERALESLRVLVRQPAPEPAPPSVWSGTVPEDLAAKGEKMHYLLPDERRAWDRLQALLADDLRFEYMNKRESERVTWRFICESHLSKGRAVVDAFIAEHAREVREHLCFFPVRLLTVSKPVEIQGATLLPLADAPTIERMRPLPQGEPGSVIQVPCQGTSYEAMATRARVIAEHSLRILRATLREGHFTADEQLRFRLGQGVWFDDGAGGWTTRPDQGWELKLDDQLLSEAMKAPLFDLPLEGTNEVERRARRALIWFEQGQLSC